MRQINDNSTCTPINCCIQFVGKFVEMANMNSLNLFNPELGLTFNRLVPVKRELIWGALTEPELFMKWFCPLPWKTTQCEIDLHPGGKFETVMPYHFLLKIIERLRR